MTTEPVLHCVRDYYWGCIYCYDVGGYDGDGDHLSGGGPFFAVDDHVAIQVANSRIVDPHDADVELNVYVHAVPMASSDHASVIVLPSGVLSIGDAGGFDEIPLRPGRWLMQVDLDPRRPEEAQWVKIHLSPADPP
ncbi:hypothetical protein [Nocardiopsis prasina]|uniref:hypothetical protein n=1 Tax=Nocardiopsis prasina TaxID=2015 RepID=UPI001EFA0261|nr:hypothetical protein [Nocardiopsis prasina]